MIELIRTAADVQAFCDARRWRFCFVGGPALQRRGEPRETVDVDVTLLTGFGGEASSRPPRPFHGVQLRRAETAGPRSSASPTMMAPAASAARRGA